jgi:trans-aconitate 2-methyltransferase
MTGRWGTSRRRPLGPLDWDASAYDRVSDPMTRWGASVVERLSLLGDETALDAGCGSGRVTAQLLDRLPSGHVIALDGSPAMVDAARERLAPYGRRVDFVVADLARRLPIEPGSMDAILSTATFHWVEDHAALFRHLAPVLRPGGQLVAQCGGHGNIASVVQAIAASGQRWSGPWTFATPEETTRRLAAAGFTEIETWLTHEPTPLEPGEPLRAYLRTVVLGAHLARMPESKRDAFVEAVADGLPAPSIDYVRLNIVAVRRR